MRLRFLITRFFVYLLVLTVAGALMFNLFLERMSDVMHKYFIERPTSYNAARAERIANSIYSSFKKEVPRPKPDSIKEFVGKYNDFPFLSVNFIYRDKDDNMKSVIGEVENIDILKAEYVYPVKYGTREVGTLLVYDINKEYEIGLAKYRLIMNSARIFFGVFLILVFSVFIYKEYSGKMKEDKILAEYRAVHDGLTGLYTQKYFKERLEVEINRAQRYKRPVSLVMCDIDHFKNFNDTYGHLAGDTMLKTVAKIIAENVRTSDIVARYGGEEFALLLIETGAQEAASIAARLKQLTDQAIEIADRIKGKIELADIDFDGQMMHATISMGLSSYDGHEDYKGEYLIGEADHALYESKNNGRNQITVFDPRTKEFKTV